MAIFESKLRPIENIDKNMLIRMWYESEAEKDRQRREDLFRNMEAQKMQQPTGGNVAQYPNVNAPFFRGQEQQMERLGAAGIGGASLSRDQWNQLYRLRPTEAVSRVATEYQTTPQEIVGNMGRAWDRQIGMTQGASASAGGQNIPENVLANAGYGGPTGQEAQEAMGRRKAEDVLYQQERQAKMGIGAQKELLGEKAKFEEQITERKFEQEKEFENLKQDHLLAIEEQRRKGYREDVANRVVQQIRTRMKFDNSPKDQELKTMMIEQYMSAGKTMREAQQEVDEWYNYRFSQANKQVDTRTEEEKIKSGI